MLENIQWKRKVFARCYRKFGAKFRLATTMHWWKTLQRKAMLVQQRKTSLNVIGLFVYCCCEICFISSLTFTRYISCYSKWFSSCTDEYVDCCASWFVLGSFRCRFERTRTSWYYGRSNWGIWIYETLIMLYLILFFIKTTKNRKFFLVNYFGLFEFWCTTWKSTLVQSLVKKKKHSFNLKWKNN